MFLLVSMFVAVVFVVFRFVRRIVLAMMILGIAVVLGIGALFYIGGHQGSPSAPSSPTSPHQPVEIHPANASLSIHQQDQNGYSWYLQQLAEAKHSIQVWAYEIDDPKIVNALVAAHRRNVSVQTILDDAYAGRAVNTDAYEALRSAGVPVRWAPESVIFHIKATIVDGQALDVLTGNFMPRYYATGMDISVVDTHSDDVAAAQHMFEIDWSGATPRKKTSQRAAALASGGPSQLLWSPGARTTFVDTIASARKSVLFSSEVLTDEKVITALTNAAGRGVRVEVLMTDGNLDAATLRELHSAGVRVVLTPDPDDDSAGSADRNAKVYVHQKSLLVDDKVALVGSQNASVASLNYNRELSLRIEDPSAVATLRNGYESVWQHYESAA